MKYRLGNQPYYRKGVLYAAGSVIELPDDEKPSRTWTKVKDQSIRADRDIEMHPGRNKKDGDEDRDDPASRPLPNTPPTAKSTSGFVPNSVREPDEEPALSAEEQKLDAAKRKEVFHKTRAEQEKLLADQASDEKKTAEKAASERKHETKHDAHKKERASDKGPFGDTK